MSRTAYSYLRFSSVKQSKGDSFRRQTEMAEELIQRKGWIMDTSLRLQDLGVSAWKGKNAVEGALAEFVKLCKAGNIKAGSILVIERLDRLSRDDVRPALKLFLDILSCGVTIATVEPEREYKPEDKDTNSLMEVLWMFQAANEHSEKLSSRLKAAWRNKRKNRKPMSKWCPHWITLEDGEYKLIPQNAKIVRRIVDLAIGGMGAIRICQVLNSEGVKSIGTRVEEWSYSYITKILRTEALIGDYRPGEEIDGHNTATGEVWHDYFPAVITKDKFFQLKGALAQRKTLDKDGNKRGKGGRVGERVSNLFSGIMFNTRDGQAMQRIIKEQPRLISAAFRNGLEGDTQSIPYAPVEAAIMQCFHQEIDVATILGKGVAVPTEDKLEALQGELLAIEESIKETKNRVKTGKKVSTLLDLLEELDTQKQDLLEAIEVEKTTQAAVGSEETALSDLQAVEDVANASKEDRSRIQARLRQLLERIDLTIYGQKRSKWKMADIMLRFKTGALFSCQITTEKEKIVELRAYAPDGYTAPDAEKLASLDVENIKYLKTFQKVPEA